LSRLFRGLRREPDRHYDAVVVGAGIGGLICAILLQRAGLSVLLVEQHYMTGGYCSTFRRGGFTFDAATHFYPLLGNSRTISGGLLAKLGVRTQWIKMDPVDHFHFPDGTDFTVPADIDQYFLRLAERFPAETAALDAFFQLARRAYTLGLLRFFRNCDGRGLDRLLPLTVKQVLDRFFQDRRLKLLLCADCSHWGAPPSRVSFVFDAMLRLAYFLGNYYPRGGSQAFADELAFQFEQAGGDILMRTRAIRIVCQNGSVLGVELLIPRGSTAVQRVRVSCPVVVSNTDLRHTVEHLLPPNSVDPLYIESIRKLRLSHPCFIMHLGLKEISEAELRRMEGYHWCSWEPERVATDQFKVFVPTLYEPGMAPPGGHIVIVQKLCRSEFDSIEDSQAYKASTERYILSELEKLMPGFGQKIVVGTSASAWTSYKYTLNRGGAMLGWEMSPDQLGASRPAIEMPIRGLYTVGHWTRPGGGITPVIVSAIHAAQAVQQRSAEDGANLYANPPELVYSAAGADALPGVV
jgi:phytoene dehydrogenase-like protein